MTNDFQTHWAYFACAAIDQQGWLPYRKLRLPIDDLGFRQGVTAVERLRTYAGRPFEINAHLERFQRTLHLIRIDHAPSSTRLRELLHELLQRNHSLVQAEGDIGITLFATPGGQANRSATLGMHLNRIDHAAVQARQTGGQPVVLTDVVQPDEKSWPRQAKVRSRLHYYLAERRAAEVIAGATGVLRDSDDTWTESSIANIALLFGNEIVWAPRARVLPGITQSVVKRIADSMSIRSSERPLTRPMIAEADAILLMGTDTGVWFASKICDQDGRTINSNSRPGEHDLVRKLQVKNHASPTRR